MNARRAWAAVAFPVVEGGAALGLLARGGVRAPRGLLPAALALPSAALLAVVLFAVLAGPQRAARIQPCWSAALARRLVLVAAVAACEEVLWRGVLLGRLVPVLGVGVALAAATLAFSFAHAPQAGRRGVAVHATTGAAFGVSYLLAGVLIVPVLTHALYNALVALAGAGRDAASGHVPGRHLELGARVWPTDGLTMASRRPDLSLRVPSPGSQPSPPAVVLERVSKRFGERTALEAVSLEVPLGEVVALLGPNGAGKTTALSLMLGLRRPDRGKIRLFGADPRSPPARALIGATPQETGFPETLRVREIAALVCAHFPAPLRVEELLDRFGLGGVAGRQSGGLSGGERRRLAVALAFAGRPRAVFLDEPTTGLDVESRQQLWTGVREYVAGGGTVLLTTHYLDEAEALATRVAVLDRGRLVAAGSVEEVVRIAGVSRVRLRASSLPQLEGVVHETEEDGCRTLYTHDPGELVTALVRAGVRLDGLQVRPASLEQAFLALTRRAG